MLGRVDKNQILQNYEAVAETVWKEKELHGQFVRELQGIDWDKTWQ